MNNNKTKKNFFKNGVINKSKKPIPQQIINHFEAQKPQNKLI